MQRSHIFKASDVRKLHDRRVCWEKHINKSEMHPIRCEVHARNNVEAPRTATSGASFSTHLRHNIPLMNARMTHFSKLHVWTYLLMFIVHSCLFLAITSSKEGKVDRFRCAVNGWTSLPFHHCLDQSGLTDGRRPSVVLKAEYLRAAGSALLTRRPLIYPSSDMCGLKTGSLMQKRGLEQSTLL